MANVYRQMKATQIYHLFHTRTHFTYHILLSLSRHTRNIGDRIVFSPQSLRWAAGVSKYIHPPPTPPLERAAPERSETPDKSLLNSNNPLENLEPRKSRRLSSPHFRPVPRWCWLALLQKEILRHSCFSPKSRQPLVLPLLRYRTTAAMLAIPDCVDKTGPTLQLGRNCKRVPTRKWRKGKGLERASGE